ncbi:septal ring lytic transglycosylase RlpA family protein [Aquisalimonas lutea]|uniref:septal ring lytic transglycosylase RlpA family protein n=1 Tax=Aquisalimonas lutea TaxID=1327750 RepID=UPI0025B342DC|nr:septal ring lytic transglycosylase RlpA family protein [Aquisalimonas lutea]MDN3516037.1 septal ring lytic transglycosylase RlpA family protein [Aquisalimonas lutea]
MTRLLLVALLSVLLAACATGPADRAPDDERDRGPEVAPDLSDVEEPEPRNEPMSRYGNPSSYEVFGRRYHVMAPEEARDYSEEGTASWYGEKFHGRRTSSGEPYDMYTFTAAHTRLPLPTYARVTNLDNDRSVVVKINDRGPFARNRIIDLSYAAADRLGMLEAGTAPVRVESLSFAYDPDNPPPAPADAAGPSGSEGSTADGTDDVVTSTRRVPERLQAQDGTAATAREAGGRFLLQMGAFSSRDNAETLRQRLAAHDVGTVAIRSGGDIHRVHVGPLGSRAEAEAIAERLRQSGFADGHVITVDNS